MRIVEKIRLLFSTKSRAAYKKGKEFGKEFSDHTLNKLTKYKENTLDSVVSILLEGYKEELQSICGANAGSSEENALIVFKAFQTVIERNIEEMKTETMKYMSEELEIARELGEDVLNCCKNLIDSIAEEQNSVLKAESFALYDQEIKKYKS